MSWLNWYDCMGILEKKRDCCLIYKLYCDHRIRDNVANHSEEAEIKVYTWS